MNGIHNRIEEIKQHNLSRQITTCTEEIEALRSEKENLLLDLGCADDADVKAVQSEITAIEASLHKLDEQKERCSVELDGILQQYEQLQSQANADSDEIQHNAVTAASSRLLQAYGKRFDAQMLRDSQKEISRLTAPMKPTALSGNSYGSLRSELKRKRHTSIRAAKRRPLPDDSENGHVISEKS